MRVCIIDYTKFPDWMASRTTQVQKQNYKHACITFAIQTHRFVDCFYFFTLSIHRLYFFVWILLSFYAIFLHIFICFVIDIHRYCCNYAYLPICCLINDYIDLQIYLTWRDEKDTIDHNFKCTRGQKVYNITWVLEKATQKNINVISPYNIII